MSSQQEGRRGFLKSLGCGLVLGFLSVFPLGKRAEIVEEPEKEKIKDGWSKVESSFWEFAPGSEDMPTGTAIPALLAVDYIAGDRIVCKWLTVNTDDSSDGHAGTVWQDTYTLDFRGWFSHLSSRTS